QVRAKRDLQIGGLDMLLYGRLDALKAGVVYDIKFSKTYERGKYLHSTQHSVYLALVPEAYEFTYLISNGANVWQETYRREETEDVRNIISDFLVWLDRHHVFYGRGLRQLSEKWGMVAILCHRCHRGTHGVHLNQELDLELKQEFQRRFEQTHSCEEFMSIFGRNYL
ncbi:MAG: hypothetical protein OSJ64_08985, partial [Firmicutes bacterium]|nr:hypothetical protein [Bacillota bacterium]